MFRTVGPAAAFAICAGLVLSCSSTDDRVDAGPAPSLDVRINSVGYFSTHPKRVIVAAAASTFDVRSAADDAIVLSGTLSAPLHDDQTGQDLQYGDFDSLSDEGRYFVDVPGVGRSATFAISGAPYDDAFRAVMLGFYGARCGTAVTFSYGGATFGHANCHTKDADLKYLGDPGKRRDGSKGWHDAGDYGKYTVNGAFSAGMLLFAWEDFGTELGAVALGIPEAGDATPDFLDEIRWQLDWLLTMPYGNGDGRVSHKLTSLAFDGFEMPEADSATRYFVPFGSAATADLAAVLAKASRAYRPFDPAFADRCLAAAQLSYAWLAANPADARPDQSAFSTGGYGTRDADDRFWAAAEIWEATGDAAALADFEARASAYGNQVDTDFDWGNVRNLGTFTYLASRRDGRSPALLGALRTAVTAAADRLLAARAANPLGRALSNYYWGSNGSVARTCMLLHMAAEVQPNPAYRETCLDQLAYLFGRNQYGRSQVTGVGVMPPLRPHHRPSGADHVSAPWPGLLVGGGQSPTDWTDEESAYSVNEVAINWNAPLAYAIAEQLGAGKDDGRADGAVSEGRDAAVEDVPSANPADAADEDVASIDGDDVGTIDGALDATAEDSPGLTSSASD
jgi:endoglucanase